MAKSKPGVDSLRPTRFVALKRPCSNCPFTRRDEAVLLHPNRRKDIGDALKAGSSFSCHKTVDYSDADRPVQGESSRCFGAAAALHNGGDRPMALEQIAVRLCGAPAPDYSGAPMDGTYSSVDDWVANAPDVDAMFRRAATNV